MIRPILLARGVGYALLTEEPKIRGLVSVWGEYTLNLIVYSLLVRMFPDLKFAPYVFMGTHTGSDIQVSAGPDMNYATMLKLEITEQESEAKGEGWLRLRFRKSERFPVHVEPSPGGALVTLSSKRHFYYIEEHDLTTCNLSICDEELRELFNDVPDNIFVRGTSAVLTQSIKEFIEFKEPLGYDYRMESHTGYIERLVSVCQAGTFTDATRKEKPGA